MSRLTCFLGTFGFDRMYVIEPCNENGYSNPVCVLQIITCRTIRGSRVSLSAGRQWKGARVLGTWRVWNVNLVPVQSEGSFSSTEIELRVCLCFTEITFCLWTLLCDSVLSITEFKFVLLISAFTVCWTVYSPLKVTCMVRLAYFSVIYVSQSLRSLVRNYFWQFSIFVLWRTLCSVFAFQG